MAEPPTCRLCGLVLASNVDTVSVDGRRHHPSCVETVFAGHNDEKRRFWLGRLAHWGNALGWGQGA